MGSAPSAWPGSAPSTTASCAAPGSDALADARRPRPRPKPPDAAARPHGPSPGSYPGKSHGFSRLAAFGRTGYAGPSAGRSSARVAKLADALDLGSSGPKALGGSTPPSRTTLGWRRPGTTTRSRNGHRMKVDVEELEGCKRRLAVEAPVDVVHAGVGARVRARAEAGAPARLPQGPRAALAGQAALRRRRAARGRRAPDSRRLPAGAHRGAARPVERARPAGRQAGGGRAADASWRWWRSGPPSRSATTRASSVQHAPGAGRPTTTWTQPSSRCASSTPSSAASSAPAAPGDLVIVDYTLAPEGHEPTTANGYALPGRRRHRAARDRRRPWSACGAGEEREVGLRFADDHRTRDAARQAGTASREAGRGQGEGPARARRRLRQGARASSRPSTRCGPRCAASSRPARQAEDTAGAGGQDRRGAAGPPRVRGAGRHGHAAGRPPGRAHPRAAAPPGRRPRPHAVGLQQARSASCGPGAEKAVRRALLLEAIADAGGDRAPPTPTWTPRSRSSPGPVSGRRRPSGV